MDIPSELLPDDQVVLGTVPRCPHCDDTGTEVGDYDDRFFECSATSGKACPVMTFVVADNESAADAVPTAETDTAACPACGVDSDTINLDNIGHTGMYVCQTTNCRVEVHTGPPSD